MNRSNKNPHGNGMREWRNGLRSGRKRLAFFTGGLFIGGLIGPFIVRNTKRKAESVLTNNVFVPAVPANEANDAFSQLGKWSKSRAHERSDVSLRILGGTLIVLGIGAFIVHASLWLWMKPHHSTMVHVARQQMLREAPSAPSGSPRLQLAPELDLQAYITKQEQELQQASRIPIERAMVLVAEEEAAKIKGDQRKIGKTASPLEIQRQRAAETRSEE